MFDTNFDRLHYSSKLENRKW